MGLTDLSGKLDSSDVNKVKMKRNPPEYESGYDGGIDVSDDSSDAAFDDLFSDMGNNDGSTGGFDMSGASNGFDGNSMNMGMDMNGGISSIFGDTQNNNVPQEVQKDRFDKAVDASLDGMVSTGKVLKETIFSFKNRTADDVGYIGRNFILVGVIVASAGFFIRLIQAVGNLKLLNGFFSNLGFSGLELISFGLIAMGVSALYLENNPEAKRTLDDIPDINDNESNFGDYEDNINDLLDEMFDMEDDEDSDEDDEYDD